MFECFFHHKIRHSSHTVHNKVHTMASSIQHTFTTSTTSTTSTPTTVLGVYVNVGVDRAAEVVSHNDLLQRLLASHATTLPREYQELWEGFQASVADLKEIQAKLLRKQKALAEGPVAPTFQAFFEEERQELEKTAEEALREAELLATVCKL